MNRFTDHRTSFDFLGRKQVQRPDQSALKSRITALTEVGGTFGGSGWESYNRDTLRIHVDSVFTDTSIRSPHEFPRIATLELVAMDGARNCYGEALIFSAEAGQSAFARYFHCQARMEWLNMVCYGRASGIGGKSHRYGYAAPEFLRDSIIIQ